MATENPVRLIGSSGDRNWPTSKDAASYASSSSTRNVTTQELGLLLQGHGFTGSRDFTGPNRSGSAPPSIEGSSLAIGDLRRHHNSSLEGIFENLTNAVDPSLSEEQLRSDPAYLAYYYSNVNLNPRLPPPLVSRENRRLAHHIGAFGENWRVSSFDDASKGSSSSSFMSRPVLSTHKEEPEDDRSPGTESEGREETNSTAFVSGQYVSPMHGRHKSLVDLIQEDFPRTPSPVYNNQSHQSSHGSKEPAASNTCGNPLLDSSISVTKEETKTATGGVRAHIPLPSSRTADTSAQSIDSNPKNDVSASLNLKSLSSSPQAEQNALNTGSENSVLPNSVSGSNVSGIKNGMRNLRISNDGNISQLSGQHLQQNNLQRQGSSFQAQIGQAQGTSQVTPRPNNPADQLSHGKPKQPLSDVQQPALMSTGIAPTVYATGAAYGTPYGPNLQPSGMYPPQFSLGGYPLNASLVSPFMAGYYPFSTVPMPLDNPANLQLGNRGAGASPGDAVSDLQSFYKFYGQFGVANQPLPDPVYMHYFQNPSVDAYTSLGQYDPTGSRVIPPANYDLQWGSSSAAQSPDQRPAPLRSGPVNIQNARKGGVSSPNYSGSPHNVAFMMQYPISPLPSPVYQGSPSAGRRNDSLRSPFNSGRSGGAFSGWQGNRGRERVDDQRPPSFLEELKSSKSRRYELSDIAGRIVEFSVDQHGSRFIQQKLETCNAEEKASVFQEVLPHASRLMTDVFGNYVIQKFFEHGNPDQRKELANRLVGHVLPLSLQMYGCRVIQKALEVIEIDQKTQLVHELDGHVMRCVRDQNGNHVIQKCIECIPTEKIDFIISAFHTNVASLSMHPYGCRVIQRVLEHCTDEMQVQCIVDEILQSACILAQDQYGNYVTQHVLERGRPLERSQIVSKLAGQVVQMSQHKFASNVIEKCLEYGTSEERNLLIEEIVGQTEGNDNLLVMMKDQFANYVVQKILDTCNDKQRDILLNRIKNHLQALKKYTYGKHIVARVERLCGEESELSE